MKRVAVLPFVSPVSNDVGPTKNLNKLQHQYKLPNYLPNNLRLKRELGLPDEFNRTIRIAMEWLSPQCRENLIMDIIELFRASGILRSA
mmetsp:Transcript_8253/g.20382  ORF Transcript_8253/g.20382 Transcript_8253/m.20382 type:complete len:89 (+) Transcript_8253:370-636(+)